MTDLRKAAEMALEALEEYSTYEGVTATADKAVTALRQALAQPKREWVNLTEEEIQECKINGGLPYSVDWRLSVKVMQIKLKEKNSG